MVGLKLRRTSYSSSMVSKVVNCVLAVVDRKMEVSVATPIISPSPIDPRGDAPIANTHLPIWTIKLSSIRHKMEFLCFCFEIWGRVTGTKI